MRRSWGRVCLALTGPAGRLPGKAEDGRGGVQKTWSGSRADLTVMVLSSTPFLLLICVSIPSIMNQFEILPGAMACMSKAYSMCENSSDLFSKLSADTF